MDDRSGHQQRAEKHGESQNVLAGRALFQGLQLLIEVACQLFFRLGQGSLRLLGSRGQGAHLDLGCRRHGAAHDGAVGGARVGEDLVDGGGQFTGLGGAFGGEAGDGSDGFEGGHCLAAVLGGAVEAAGILRDDGIAEALDHVLEGRFRLLAALRGGE